MCARTSVEIESGIEQGARRMRHERAVLANVGVQLPERIAVAADGEVGNPPHAFAQNVDDRADVEEVHPTTCRAQFPDLQASCPRSSGLTLRISSETLLLRHGTHEALDDLERRCWSNVLGKVRAPWDKHSSDLTPVRLHGVTARHEFEAGVRERQRFTLLARNRLHSAR